MSEPSVDVVIPVYNGASTVESAVASIQEQTVRDIRILVVNDGSTDGSRAILERMAAADPRVVLLNRENGGIVDALNAGLAACTAELVARHDADDLALPDRFARQIAWFRDHPRCSAVSGAVIHIDVNGRELGPKVALDSPDLADPLLYPQKEPYLVHPFLMMRRAAVMAAGGYRHVFHAEDTDLYWRLQETGELANMDDLLGYYRVHNQSVTGSSTLNGRISAVNSQLSGLLRCGGGRAGRTSHSRGKSWPSSSRRAACARSSRWGPAGSMRMRRRGLRPRARPSCWSWRGIGPTSWMRGIAPSSRNP